MKKNIFVKILITCIFVIIISNLLNIQPSYALGDFFTEGKDFVATGAKQQKINKEALKETSDTIYNTLLAIGIMVAIIIAMILGIQFIVASADERAKVKEAFMPFIIGCFVVFGAFTIWKVAVNIGNKAEDNITTEFSETIEQIYAYTDEQLKAGGMSLIESYYYDLLDLSLNGKETPDPSTCIKCIANARIKEVAEVVRPFYQEWAKKATQELNTPVDSIYNMRYKDLDAYYMEIVQLYNDGAIFLNMYHDQPEADLVLKINERRVEVDSYWFKITQERHEKGIWDVNID